MSGKRTYLLDGRTIFANPIETRDEESGTTSISLGFPVCEIGEYVDSPMAVCNLLNLGQRAADAGLSSPSLEAGAVEKVRDALEAVNSWINMNYDRDPVPDSVRALQAIVLDAAALLSQESPDNG